MKKAKRKAELTKLNLKLLNGETVPVEATIVGDLALHRAVKEDRKFSVTHVPTLLVINAVVPGEIKDDETKLLKWMRLVQEGVKKDWMLLRKLSHEDAAKNPDAGKVMRERVRNYCLSITGDKL